MPRPEEYATPAAIWTAIKAASGNAATEKGISKQNLIQLQLFDRFLARVFANDDAPFILKGGTRMLAFIPHARATLDVDLETSIDGVEVAITALEALVSVDIGDRLRFTLSKRQQRRSGEDQPNITMVTLTFAVTGSNQQMKVDLALHHRAGAAIVRAAPAFRVPLPREVLSPEYVMIATETQVADKVAAMMETHHGGPDGRSTRAKDLVDIALIAQNLSCDAQQLRHAIEIQIVERNLTRFTHVDASLQIQAGYPNVAKAVRNMTLTGEEAVALTNALVSPVLDGTVTTGSWDPARGEWAP